MGHIIVEQIITADGFVQDSDGGMKFMDAAPIDSTDSEQLEMFERVGAIVLGRNTYEMFVDYWPTVDPEDEPVAGPINSLPEHVVSNTTDVLFRAGLVDVLRLRCIPSLIGSGRGPTPSGLEQAVIKQVSSHAGSGRVTTEYAVGER